MGTDEKELERTKQEGGDEEELQDVRIPPILVDKLTISKSTNSKTN